MDNELDLMKSAYDEHFVLDNQLMLNWYPDRVIDMARGCSLLELGLGHGYSTDRFARAFERYMVVEGSSEMIARFRSRFPGENVEIIQGYFENFETNEIFDNINLGFVLEHVDDPELILKRYRRFLAPGGSLFISVPNCESLHRRFGHAAGMLPDMTALSQADLDFGHKRFFSIATLSDMVHDCGYRIVRTEGLFLKPITTGQLEALRMPPAILRAMMIVGVDYPELSNSILMHVQSA